MGEETESAEVERAALTRRKLLDRAAGSVSWFIVLAAMAFTRSDTNPTWATVLALVAGFIAAYALKHINALLRVWDQP